MVTNMNNANAGRSPAIGNMKQCFIVGSNYNICFYQSKNQVNKVFTKNLMYFPVGSCYFLFSFLHYEFLFGYFLVNACFPLSFSSGKL